MEPISYNINKLQNDITKLQEDFTKLKFENINLQIKINELLDNNLPFYERFLLYIFTNYHR
jgi:hypothetical protein